jgi:hypothetical protein
MKRRLPLLCTFETCRWALRMSAYRVDRKWSDIVKMTRLTRFKHAQFRISAAQMEDPTISLVAICCFDVLI